MTNVFGRPGKLETKKRLFGIGVKALEKAGWKVERVRGSGKSSVRRITKGAANKLVCIRTTQNTDIAFPRTKDNKGWRTLDEVDQVVVVSVDDRDHAKFAKVHVIDGGEMRERFNRGYAARMKAGHSIPIGRGMWVPLYIPEAQDPVSHIGAGAGLKFPAIEIVPLASAASEDQAATGELERPDADDGGPLTIAEAKRRLAIEFGVRPENVKITVEA